MLISTKGRYALCVLVDMAQNNGNKEYICVKEIADRQDISRKYLEAIMTLLSKNKLIESYPGKCGGYKLLKKPEEYRLYDVLMLTEESLAPVPCLKADAEECNKKDKCVTLKTWIQLDEMIKSFFNDKTVADLVKENNCFVQ